MYPGRFGVWLCVFSLVLHISPSISAAAVDTVDTKTWRFSAAWELPASSINTIQVCTTRDEHASSARLADSAIVAVARLDSVGESAVDDALQNVETRGVHADPDPIQDGSEITINDAKSNLFALKLAQGDNCIRTTLTVGSAGFYLVSATEALDVSLLLERTNASLPPARCLTGCDLNAHKLASAGGQTVSISNAVAASLLVSLTSFGGVLVLRAFGEAESLVEYMTTFAAGCLVGVVVFHLLPEGSEKLTSGGDDDDGVPDWLVGAYVLLGIVLSLAVEVQVHVWLSDGESHHSHSHGHSHDHLPVKRSHAESLPTDTPSASSSLATMSPSPTSPTSSMPPTPCRETSISVISAVEDSDGASHGGPASEPLPPPQMPAIAPIAWMTAAGDFCHAFTDGVVLAVAFQSCAASLGWAVALGVLLHEVPHRIGDFFVFVRAGMSTRQAVVVNLLASLGSLAGVLTIASLGSVSDASLGAMLAVGAGALLFIALAELLPPVLALHDQRSALGHLCWFVLGTGLLWLSALREVECDAGSAH